MIVEFYTLGFGDRFQIGIDQVYGGVMIGSSILRNSDKMFLDSYARCNLRMFSCKKTRARANTYFQKFEVCITVTRKFPVNSNGRMERLM